MELQFLISHKENARTSFFCVVVSFVLDDYSWVSYCEGLAREYGDVIIDPRFTLSFVQCHIMWA
jgi:hypothetical protein